MADDRTRRRLDIAYGLVALVGMVVVVWERLNPEGPQLAWERAKAGVGDWRGYRQAMRRTLAEIDQLPVHQPEAVESPLPSESVDPTQRPPGLET